ncbi:caspase, EACC1-associated type [Lentzea jiangxiensis]|uniref:Chaperonin GroEL n=1 Tax=Lentzea jiangxiensis TaxID=641025 RepID=A0A1H0GSM7_9PSEU|nr:TCP-1/cpn60 chaperonin family protein [Lentzea jiangxiensis]SDO09681.1 chaperonin GroEL [Lentzea jiangxiensis]
MSRHALLVAVGDYEDPRLNALRAPQQDVTRLAAVLEDPAVGGFDSVRVVVDAPDHEIRKALENALAERDADDLVLVYFSCHGVKTPQQRLYFAATNTQQDRPAGTAVARTFVNELFEDCRAAGRILLLDCCFSGAYGKGIKASAGGSVLDDRSGEGYVVLTASDAFEYAFEEGGLSLKAPRASVFTDVLLEGLSSGAADLNGDGWIDVQELFGYVHREVTARRRDQTPKFFAHGADPAIRIARAGGSRVVPARAVKPMYTPQQMVVARGFKAAAEPICRTLGPLGRRSVVLGEDGRYVELADAAAIAEAFRVSDPRDELGASYVRDVVRQARHQVGDGAATAVVIAQALIGNVLEALRAGAHPALLNRELDDAFQAVRRYFRDNRRYLEAPEEAARFATSTSGDPEIGELVGRTVEHVGWNGTLVVEESSRLGLGMELTCGIRFEGGYLSGSFVTDAARQVAELETAFVLLSSDEITSAATLTPVLDKVAKEGKPLVVVAPDVIGEALAALVARAPGAVAVRGPRDPEVFRRIAWAVEGKVLPADRLQQAELAELGQVRKVSVSEYETVVVAHGYHPVRTPSVIAVLTVGVLGETALAERRRRLERAVLTVRLAADDGVVLGGGVALAGAADVLDASNPAHAALADALRKPRRQIALNAGSDPSAAVAEPVFDAVGVLSTAVGLAVRTAQRFLLLG